MMLNPETGVHNIISDTQPLFEWSEGTAVIKVESLSFWTLLPNFFHLGFSSGGLYTFPKPL